MSVGGLVLLLLGVGVGYFISRGGADRLRSVARQRVPWRRQERERLRAIYKLTASLINTLNYERVLEIALDMSSAAFADRDKPDLQLISAILLFDNELLVVKSARHFAQPDLRATLPGLNGGIGRAVTRGEASLVLDPPNDPELGRIVALRSCQAVYCIPLRSGLDIFGVMVFGHPELRFFNADNREILEIIASQAIAAIQNARLYQDLDAEKVRMAEAQEGARKKLARDLHDGPTQSVAAIAMRVNFARRLIERDQNEAAEELFKIEELARRTTKEIRHMLFTLRPLVLESQGLKVALEEMAAKVGETFDLRMTLEIDEDLTAEFDMSRLGVIFYIIEEAVNNARKHARARNITVRLIKSDKPDVALLEVIDDGVGFNVKAVAASYDSRGSLGMVHLRERAELVRGVLQVGSKLGVGTRVQVYLPLNDGAAERLWHGR